jgi:hypothetical protein
VHASADRRRLEIKTEDDDSLVQRLPRAKVGNIGNDEVEIRLGGRGRVILLNLTDKSSQILIPERKMYYDGKMGSLGANLS